MQNICTYSSNFIFRSLNNTKIFKIVYLIFKNRIFIFCNISLKLNKSVTMEFEATIMLARIASSSWSTWRTEASLSFNSGSVIFDSSGEVMTGGILPNRWKE